MRASSIAVRRNGRPNRPWDVAARALLALAILGCQPNTPSEAPNLPSSAAAPTETGAAPASSAEATNAPAVDSPPSEMAPAAPPTPSSADLILAAQRAGRIDEPTAILYRVYALFGDSRLPTEFATDTWHEDSAALASATLQLDTLPEEVAAELKPFLVRPTDPTSVFHADVTAARLPGNTNRLAIHGGGGTLGAAFSPSDLVCESSGWAHLDGGVLLNGPAWMVWVPCNDTQAAGQAVIVADLMDSLYPAETRLMGANIPDGGGPAEAGDGALDIYLVNQCVATSGRCLGGQFPAADAGAIAYTAPASPYLGAPGARRSSAYVVFKRSFMGPNTAGSMAHELFHVLQFAHNMEGVNFGGEWSWFLDASAKWSEFFFYPAGNPVNVYGWLNTYQRAALGLNDVAGGMAYASWMWPLFMQQEKTERSIAAAWTAIEGQKGPIPVNAAISRQLSFETRYRDFAVRTWNAALTPASPDPLDPRFQVLDGQLPRTGPAPPRFGVWDRLQGNPPGTPPRMMPETIPALGTRYTRFDRGANVHQIVVDFSGLQPADRVDVDVLLDIFDEGWERRKLPPGETRFCLDTPDDDILSMIVVLSNHAMDPAAAVTGNWTVESLKEPCIGWKVKIVWTDTFDGIDDVITFDGVIDTIDQNPSGGEELFMTGIGTATGSRPGWKACNPGIDTVPSGSVRAEFVAIVLDETITISAFAGFDTTLAGVNTAPFEVAVDGETVALPAGRPIGDLCPRTSQGIITVTNLQPP